MKKSLGSLVLLSMLSLTAVASADVAPDPCEGKAEGDACTTFDDKDGTCQADGNLLECIETSATTTSSTTSGAGGGGTGGGTGEGGGPTTDDGGSEDDGGCSVAAVGAPVAAGSMSLLGLAVLVGARVAGRRRKQG
jgi:hypothetical protein